MSNQENKSTNSEFGFEPDDTFLVSYPRSGNTWVRYLLANVLFPGNEWNISNLNQAVPDIHQDIPENYLNQKPRVFKSHFKSMEEYKKVIYLYRDGRDVAASYYNRKEKLRNYKNDFNVFLDEFLEGALKYGSWQSHVAFWMRKKNGTNIIYIRYEDLVSETGHFLRRILDFLGFDADKSVIDKAIINSSFTKQQADIKEYLFESHWARGFKGGIKAAPGKWHEKFDEDMNNKFLSRSGELLKELGYELNLK